MTLTRLKLQLFLDHTKYNLKTKVIDVVLQQCDLILLGRIIWLTGAPGMGKSTSAQILARNHGYVYYEADCFAILKNPYIPLEVENPSLAQVHQATLKGPGMEERKVVIERFRNLGFSYDGAVMLDYYQLLAADIAREKARVGGDWTVAAVLLKRENRDQLRWV